MEIVLAVLGIGGFIAVCIWIGAFVLPKMRKRADERQFARNVEAQMRYDIAYAAAQKKAADKILRERGEKP